MVSISGGSMDGRHFRALEHALADGAEVDVVRKRFDVLFGPHTQRVRTGKRAVRETAGLVREWNVARRGARAGDLERFFRMLSRHDPEDAADLVCEARGWRDASGKDDPFGGEADGGMLVETDPDPRLAWLLDLPPAAAAPLVRRSDAKGRFDRLARYRLIEAWPEALEAEVVQQAWLAIPIYGIAADFLFARLEGQRAADLVRWWIETAPGSAADWLTQVVDGRRKDFAHLWAALTEEDLVGLLTAPSELARQRGLALLGRLKGRGKISAAGPDR